MQTGPEFGVRPLDATTWPDFAGLVERHNGVWGGCWCLGFHEEGATGIRTPEERQRLKKARVEEGRAHAALVYDGQTCVGWCQFGPTDELPRIKFRRAYEQGLSALPDWRITCFFVDRRYRRKGVSSAALDGALTEIARLGEGKWRVIPRRSPAGRYLRRFSTTARWPCLSGSGSPGSADSARTIGW